MTDVYIGLGSNFGHAEEHVRLAFQQLNELPSTRLVGISSLYRTKPVGPPNQPDYINAAAKISTALAPLVLLHHLQKLERKHGRVRLQKWGKRTLDLDILLYGTKTIHHPRLQIPHPLLHLRPFVLVPLAEIDPDLIIPRKGKIIRLATKRTVKSNCLPCG